MSKINLESSIITKEAVINSFSKSTKYEGKLVISVTVSQVDDLTGVVYEDTELWLVIPNYYYTNLIGKKVLLTIVPADKVKPGFKVVAKIELAE